MIYHLGQLKEPLELLSYTDSPKLCRDDGLPASMFVPYPNLPPDGRVGLANACLLPDDLLAKSMELFPPSPQECRQQSHCTQYALQAIAEEEESCNPEEKRCRVSKLFDTFTRGRVLIYLSGHQVVAAFKVCDALADAGVRVGE